MSLRTRRRSSIGAGFYPVLVERSLAELQRVNRLLFGYRSVHRTVLPRLAAAEAGGGEPAILLDLGTGSGDGAAPAGPGGRTAGRSPARGASTGGSPTWWSAASRHPGSCGWWPPRPPSPSPTAPSTGARASSSTTSAAGQPADPGRDATLRPARGGGRRPAPEPPGPLAPAPPLSVAGDRPRGARRRPAVAGPELETPRWRSWSTACRCELRRRFPFRWRLVVRALPPGDPPPPATARSRPPRVTAVTIAPATAASRAPPPG